MKTIGHKLFDLSIGKLCENIENVDNLTQNHQLYSHFLKTVLFTIKIALCYLKHVYFQWQESFYIQRYRSCHDNLVKQAYFSSKSVGSYGIGYHLAEPLLHISDQSYGYLSYMYMYKTGWTAVLTL